MDDDQTPPEDHSPSASTSMIRKPPETLEDIAREDPKRAKRILTNRRSAMSAKQRKKLYVHTLEYNLERLHGEAAGLSAQLNLWETDACYITEDNKRLRQCLEHIEKQIQLQDTLMEETKKGIEDLKKIVPSHKNSKD